MIPSSHATAPFGTAAWDENPRVEHDTRGIGMSSPWSLPADEAAKLDRLARGEVLSLSRMVEDCLNRVAEVDPESPGTEFNQAIESGRQRIRPSDAEVAAMIAEVPLCLLNGRERQQALALRQHGVLASGATAHVFDPDASREKLILACMHALQAARGDARAPWAAALAKLARWETDVRSDRKAEARASGGRALRDIVRHPLQQDLLLCGQGLTRDPASHFSLPSPALIKELRVTPRDFRVYLGTAWPVDIPEFRDLQTALDLRHWDLHVDDDQGIRRAVIPEHATHVSLRGDANRCARFALTLALRAGPDLQRVNVHPVRPGTTQDLPPAPDGWLLDSSSGDWSLIRQSSTNASTPASVFASWGSEDPETLWRMLGASEDGKILVDFLAESSTQLAGLGPLYADIVRQEMTTLSRSLLQMLAAKPALLSELSDDLRGPWTCIDAKRKTLASMDQTLRAGTDPGALLRMSFHHLTDLQVGTRDDVRDPIEHALSLRALLDLRLAQITGTSFIRTGVPYFASDGGMNRRALGREPVLEDWKDSQRQAVEQILGDEVRADFPMLREFMRSKSGAAHRAVETLRLDASYRTANDEWEQRFLEAGNLVDDAPSDIEAVRRYEELQEQMPLELERLTLALMDARLAPLRRAYPTSTGS